MIRFIEILSATFYSLLPYTAERTKTQLAAEIIPCTDRLEHDSRNIFQHSIRHISSVATVVVERVAGSLRNGRSLAPTRWNDH